MGVFEIYLISNLLEICISCFDSLYKIKKTKHVFNFYLFIVIDNYFIDEAWNIQNIENGIRD